MRKFLLAIIMLTWFLPSKGQELVVNFTYTTVCLGGTTQFKSSCSVDTTTQPKDTIISIAWDLHGDGMFQDGNDTVNATIYSSPGKHSVGLKAITKNGIAKAIYKLVPVNFLTPLFSTTSTCIQEPARFTNQTLIYGDSAVVHYLWRFGDGSMNSTAKNPTHFYPGAGTYRVTMVASFNDTCKDSVSHSLKVTGNPVVIIDYSRDTVMHRVDTLIASVRGTYDSVRWSTNEKTYTILIIKAGYYSVEAFNQSCSGQAGFNVTVTEPGPEPVIANLFTPNGDGYNDRWEILNLSDFKPCEVNVFNRYGIEVFSSSNYNNDWDGTFNGKKLENDTYYYFVRCHNQILYKGNVNILK
ncbi:MAG: gliding motility-associated C-terminal domain-containing protein [Bacteroidetes bacterium]|nr:gliding motility-associated C-terminal domain-containing protein [Bacteroidota bacterium]